MKQETKELISTGSDGIVYKILLDEEGYNKAIGVLQRGNQKWSPDWQNTGWFVTTIIDPAGGYIEKKWRGKKWRQRKRKTLYLHRFVLDASGDTNVVHLNGNKLDNRKANLKAFTRQETIKWENENITEDIENGKTKKMIISGKHNEYEVYLDAEDWETVNQHKWALKPCSGDLRYVSTAIPHPSGNTYDYFFKKEHRMMRKARASWLMMHRLIMKSKPNEIIDHINGNGLDNRKQNLRICTHIQNSYNRRKNANNTSGYKGVKRACGNYYSQLRKKGIIKWVAQINHEGKRIHLGVYDTKEEAAKIYDKRALELHGKFAKLNFPSNM
jgi:hypothetical protein